MNIKTLIAEYDEIKRLQLHEISQQNPNEENVARLDEKLTSLFETVLTTPSHESDNIPLLADFLLEQLIPDGERSEIQARIMEAIFQIVKNSQT